MGFSPGGLAEQSGSGSVAALNQAVTLSVPYAGTALVQILGTWSGTLVIEATVDGTNWFQWAADDVLTGIRSQSYTANARLWVPVSGTLAVRIRASSWVSGTANIAWNADSGTLVQASPIGQTVTVQPLELPTFVAVVQASAISNNRSMISLMNTGTSTVRISRVFLINQQNTAVTGQVLDFRMFRITGHSGGTDLTSDPMDTEDTLPAGITVKTNATVAGEAARFLRRIQWSSDEWGVGTLDSESYEHAQQAQRPYYEPASGVKPIVLRQNQGIHIRQATNTTAGSFDVLLEYTIA